MAGIGSVRDVPSSDAAYLEVAVAGTPPVTFCINPSAGDPVATWFRDNGWIDEPVQRAFLGLVRPGSRVLDLGCHLGTFSLAAAGIGGRVVAVDAAPEHVRLVSLAAERNGFEAFEAVHAAIAGPGGGGPGRTVRFVVRSIHGHVQAAGEIADDSIDVPLITVDEVLAHVGWAGLDVVKMDIEGSEVAALRGMGGLFGTGCRPAMVIESNEAMLGQLGSSVVELRTLLSDLGYGLWLIDHLRPGVLVQTSPEAVQTESASDLLALPPLRTPGPEWRVEPPLSRESTVTRLLGAAASPAAGYRQAAAGVLRNGPHWLRSTGAVPAAVAALDHDVDEAVRPGRGSRLAGYEYADTVEPVSDGAPATAAVWAEHLSLAPPPTDMERPFELAASTEAAWLRDLSFHVGIGEPVALLTEDVNRARLLLGAVSGRVRPLTGELTVRGSVVSLVSIRQGLEPDLTVAENGALFGAFLGCHVPTVQAQLDEILAAVGLDGRADLPLHRAGPEAVVRLCLGVALGCRRPDILLIDHLPTVTDPTFTGWSRARIWELSVGSTAVVQLIRDRSELYIEPTRVLWLHGDRIVAAGHAESVLEEARLEQLGYSSGPGAWVERGRR